MSDPTDQFMQMRGFPSADFNFGASGALVKMDGMKPSENGTIIYFTCEDCSIEESRVESAGGKVCQPKMGIGEYGFISLAFDTEGNMIGLHSLK